MISTEEFRFAKFQEHYFNMCDLAHHIPRIQSILSNTRDREERHLILANIPSKYWKFELEHILNDLTNQETMLEPVSMIRNYIEKLHIMFKEGVGLYLEGSNGTSKTTVATIILREAMKLHYRVFFCSSLDLIEFITMGWKNDAFKGRWQYILDTVDFLVIDDVGRELNIDAKEKTFLDKLFVNRSNLRLPTILTSNVSKTDMKDKFSKSLFSLFSENLCSVELIRTDVRIDYEKKNKSLILGE